MNNVAHLGITNADYRWQEYEFYNGSWVPLVRFRGTPQQTIQDTGSSWGPCVSIWAPAQNLRVAHRNPSYNGGTAGIGFISLSGTSFSAPLVTGTIARYFSKAEQLGDPRNFNSGMPDLAWSYYFECFVRLRAGY